jgi:peptidoglycan/xylan/chitin deacetylase (PgdA/CDA1 family)
MDLPCPIHQGRRAHRGCHYCRKPICRLCELKMRGHLYCSPRCSREDGRLAFWRPVRARLVRPVPPRLALAAVALAVAAPMLLALRTVGELDRLSLQTSTPPPLRRQPVARVETVTETPTGIRIEGSAPEGGAVFLFGASGFVASTPSENGRFHFDSVREAGPYRVGFLPLSIGMEAPPVPAPPAGNFGLAPSGSPRPSFSPISRLPSSDSNLVPDLTRGPRDRPDIVLSFDAGSTARGARDILDALAARGIRTTIFLTGDFIRRHPDLARRIAADAHEVGNHTDTHPHMTTYAEDGRQATRPDVDRDFVARQLRVTAEAWRTATSRSMAPLWRAPYGEHNRQIRHWAAQEGYWHVGWTGGRAGLDGLDWVSDPASRSYRSAGRVVDRLVARAENGGIVLLHLGSDREDPIAPRVPELLDSLTRRGFRFARASEFLARMGMTDERLLAIASGGRAGAP